MGLFGFGDKNAPPLSQPGPTGPTLESVRALLEEIGKFRLQLKSAEIKVFVTQIAWNSERFLDGNSSNGTPSEVQIIKLTNILDTAFQVIKAFAQHEQAPLSDPENQDRLARETAAIRQFAASVTQNVATQGFAASMNADVNTELLQRLTITS